MLNSIAVLRSKKMCEIRLIHTGWHLCLCAAVLLGLDFQSHLQSVTLQYNGPLPPLTDSNRQYLNCPSRPTFNLSTLNVPPPSLFANLTPDCKPVATKSRRYSTEDRSFIRTEMQRLLNEGIIEASNSPWQAQMVVVKTTGWSLTGTRSWTCILSRAFLIWSIRLRTIVFSPPRT